jgi:hypothetical protein
MSAGICCKERGTTHVGALFSSVRNGRRTYKGYQTYIFVSPQAGAAHCHQGLGADAPDSNPLIQQRPLARRLLPARKACQRCLAASFRLLLIDQFAEPNKSECEPTSGHPRNCGSEHVTQVFCDTGRMFSWPLLMHLGAAPLQHPLPFGSLFEK